MLVIKKICDGLSDLEIIQKSLEEVDYFSCLFERYEAKLLRYVKRMASVNEDEAEDILQESFIKIWKNLNAFDQGMKLSSWLYRIVHNHTVSFVRKKKSFGKDQQVEWNENYFTNLSEEASTEIAGEEIDQDLLTHEILGKMPQAYREVLVLKFLEGLSYREISDVLKLPEGTVATRINRAKKAFKELSKVQQVNFEF